MPDDIVKWLQQEIQDGDDYLNRIPESVSERAQQAMRLMCLAEVESLRSRLANLQLEITHQSNTRAGQQRRAEMAEVRLAEADALLLKAEQNELMLVEKLDTADALLLEAQDALSELSAFPGLLTRIDAHLARKE